MISTEVKIVSFIVCHIVGCLVAYMVKVRGIQGW